MDLDLLEMLPCLLLPLAPALFQDLCEYVQRNQTPRIHGLAGAKRCGSSVEKRRSKKTHLLVSNILRLRNTVCWNIACLKPLGLVHPDVSREANILQNHHLAEAQGHTHQSVGPSFKARIKLGKCLKRHIGSIAEWQKKDQAWF